MDNKDIVKILRKTAALMELHGENEFKVRSYNNAVFNIERLNVKLEDLTLEETENLQGVGKSIAAKIQEILDSGTLSIYEDYLSKTPPGIIEIMDIKGLGMKKIYALWHEAGVDSIEKLELGLRTDAFTDLKGFGEKTRDKLLDQIQYYKSNKVKLHYSEAEKLAEKLKSEIGKSIDNDSEVLFTGELRRNMEVISKIELLVKTEEYPSILKALKESELIEIDENASSPYAIHGSYGNGTPVTIHLADDSLFNSQLLITTGSSAHITSPLKDGLNILQIVKGKELSSEKDFYEKLGYSYIPPEIREGQFEFNIASSNKIPDLLEMKDLKGILHNHSTYSDGQNSLKEMAEYCKELGYEYLGIADHSKAAFFYANGLDEDRVKQQHEEIDILNKELAPFKIFKGIESDILPDGELDFDTETLASFDYIVASIHSGLSMDAEKATKRLIKAVENPFTTILGHPTGRLLLVREGYPADMKKVIDACAENNVIIEINAHPYRLDLDWRLVHYALEKGVILSINPDAHEKKGYHDMYYGVCVGRKGGLTADKTFNAFPIEKVNEYFENRRTRAMETVGIF